MPKMPDTAVQLDAAGGGMRAEVFRMPPKPPASARLPRRTVTRHAQASHAQQRATARVRRAHCTVVDKPPRSVPPRNHDAWYLEEHDRLQSARFAKSVVYQGHQTNVARVAELAHRAADAKAADRAAALKTDRDRLRVMRSLQARFKAALYGRDLEKIFRRYDSGKLGDLTVHDLTRVVRGHLRMTPRAVNEEDIQFLVDELDADLSGSISLEELESFVKWGERAFHSWVSSGNMVAASAVHVVSHRQDWQPPSKSA